MNDKLLHHAIARAQGAARPPAPTPPAPPPERLSPIQKGRFHRWHAEAAPQPEEEGWLLTYLDMMTLLLVMLVVMLAFSEPITRKPPLGRPEAQGSGAPASVQPPLGGGGSVVPPLGLPAPTPGPGERPAERQVPEAPPEAPAVSEGVPAPTAPPSPAAEAASALGDLGRDIQVLVQDEGVSFRIPSEVLFASGEAELTPAGRALIDRLLPAFNRVPDYTIVVEGHTDNVPIQTARFPSNWELAAARASSVVRQLEARGLNPTRLRATGYADTRPLAPNSTPQGRTQNRRVEITLEPPQRLRN